MSNINIDYTNLKEFVKFINAIGGYENKKYENSYAIRGGESYDSSLHITSTQSEVNLDDFNALVNYISGADTTTVIGKECNITTSCEYLVNGNGTLNTINPPQRKINWSDNDLYSKCYYQHIDGSKTDIIKDSPSVINNTNNPDCDSNNKCPTDVYYSWDTNIGFNSTLPGQFWPYDDERSRPGKCVKKYGQDPNDKSLYTTDILNDPYIASGATIDINGKYECKSVGTKLGESPEPSEDSPDNARIHSNSTDQIALECNDATSIWYNGDTQEHRKGALGLDTLTQDCVINQTNAHYVTKNFADKIENNENITRADLDVDSNMCESHMPLYVEDSTERAKYDVPHPNGSGAEYWWNNNTCKWINEIPLVRNGSWLQKNAIRFLPPQFNGECKIDEVVGSGEHVGSSGSGIVNSDGDNKDISAFIKPSQMDMIRNEGLFNYDSNNTDFYPGVNYEKPISSTDYTNIIDNYPNSQCNWELNSNKKYNQSNNKNPMISILPDQADPNNSDANGILYSNNITANYSTPIYYKKDGYDRHDSKSRLVLNNTDNESNTTKFRQITECSYPTTSKGALNFSSQGKWYETNTINNNLVNVPDTNNLYYNYTSNNVSTANQAEGYGSGQCLVHMQVEQPEYSHTFGANSAHILKNLEHQTGLTSSQYYKLRRRPGSSGSSSILPPKSTQNFYYSIPDSVCGQTLDINKINADDGSFNYQMLNNNTEDSQLTLEHAWIKSS